MKIRFLTIVLLCAALTSCKDKVAESQIAAQIGNSILLVSDVKTQIPIGITGADSAAFAAELIDRWVEEQLLFEQGLRHLPNIKNLEQQAEEYKKMLISQTYENELLNMRIPTTFTEEETREFYKKHEKHLKLEQPVIKGVFIKLMINSSKINVVKKWLKELDDDKTDCIEEFDQFGMERAADYDNFYDTWVNLPRLSDKLPETIIDAASFLKCKTYEMKDDKYCYLFVIKDYRVTGETAPYEYAQKEIYELLVAQRRKALKREIIEELKDNAIKTNFLKIY